MRTIWWAGVLSIGFVLGLAAAHTIWPAAAQPAARPDVTRTLAYSVETLSVDTARLQDAVAELRERASLLERRMAMLEARMEPAKP